MKLLIVLVACLVLYSEAKPANLQLDGLFDDDFEQSDVSECHGITCPTGTVACSKTTKTSADKKILHTTVQCEDVQGNVLNSATKSSENPFENTQISSFSFTGHYNYNGGSTAVIKPKTNYENTYYANNNYNNHNDEVETFA